ncbi:MAG: type II toxin-antitoxin system VapC family toxin [Actinomycetota bacterium]
MTLVVDSSVVVAALVDGGPDGAWSAAILEHGLLAAPHLMPAEVGNVLRRAVLRRDVSAEVAALAHEDLMQLRVELHGYEPYGRRVWELRDSLSAYDAWYVAVAEALDAPLATLDLRLVRSDGPACEFRLPR